MSSIQHQPQIPYQPPEPSEPTFNPLTHIPPKYDIFGYMKPQHKCKEYMNILNDKDKIKIPWPETTTNESKVNTLTELKEKFHKEKIPDISYDLDKDGYVGGRDYVLSKLYDVDKDGKLNEQEKKAAYEGIANHVEDNYIWNIDNQGGTRPFRLLQKRGKFVDAEDFLPVRDTYPKHPISDINPKYKTFTQLKEARKKEMIDNINDKIKNWEKNNPQVFIEESSVNELSKHKPKHSTYTEIIKEKHEEFRKNVGLEVKETEIRDTKNAPTLKYVYDPKHKTKKDIDDELKKENLEQSKKLMNITHRDEIARLNEREDEIFAKLYSNVEGKTFTAIKEKRRKETNEYNIKTFSKQTIGVHGHELPKFAESKTMKEFWKLRDGYCENPKIVSHLEFKENIKYWKPSEELYLNEHRDELPQSIDPFKKEHHPQKDEKKEFEKKLILKVNTLNHFKGFDPKNPQPIDIENIKKKHIYRWTTLVNQFAPNKFKKGRFFDVLPPAKNHEAEDKKELYSSFVAKYPFLSNYMNNVFLNGEKKEQINQKSEQDKGNNDMYKTAKDALFHKFSNKELQKDPIPKGAAARTKGF